MKNILIVLLTSLFWAIILTLFFEPRSFEAQEQTPVEVEAPAPKKPKAEKAKKAEKAERTPDKGVSDDKKVDITKQPTPVDNVDLVKTTPKEDKIDYSREIVGKWTPVEGGKHPLEFTKYGCVIQTNGINWRYDYSLDGKKLAIKYDNNARIEITKENNGTAYLELFNSAEFSGKYKRISQPLHIEMTPISSSLYSDKIVGKWQPVNGHEEAIEFTKYGTAIRTEFTLERRYDYSLNGSSLNIKYDKSRIVISEDASYYYLEIYNSREFSGRYRRSK